MGVVDPFPINKLCSISTSPSQGKKKSRSESLYIKNFLLHKYIGILQGPIPQSKNVYNFYSFNLNLEI